MENTEKIFDISTLKHVLFLENEFWRDDQLINELYEWFVENNITCTIIDQASHKKDEIRALLPQIDCIAFQSTFLYEDEVKGVGDLLKNMPKSLTVFGLPTGDQGLEYFIERIWKVSELAQMSHHNVYELEHILFRKFNDFDDLTWCRKVDMLVYKKEWERLEHERVTKNKNMPKTGNKVLIKDIQAVGQQWSNLKEGDIVDELDCSSIDTNPARGIWVMGLDEPVKLLNSDGYEEWEYHNPTYLALTKEFFSRGNRANANVSPKYKSIFDALSEWIRKCSSELQTSDSELWEWCDNICTSVGVERRVNRRYFERRLKEYRSKHTYFREKSLTSF